MHSYTQERPCNLFTPLHRILFSFPIFFSLALYKIKKEEKKENYNNDTTTRDVSVEKGKRKMLVQLWGTLLIGFIDKEEEIVD